MKIFLIITLTPCLILLLAFFIRTYQIQNDRLNKMFRESYIGKYLPQGAYAGVAFVPTEFTRNWQGKNFSESTSSGINLFNDELLREEKYVFKMQKTKSISEKYLDVIQLDYNTDENPAWLKPVVDEIVNIGDGKYLGKVYYRLIPGLPFALAYFTLEKIDEKN